MRWAEERYITDVSASEIPHANATRSTSAVHFRVHGSELPSLLTFLFHPHSNFRTSRNSHSWN